MLNKWLYTQERGEGDCVFQKKIEKKGLKSHFEFFCRKSLELCIGK